MSNILQNSAGAKRARAAARRRATPRQIFEAVQHERERIGQDLHDDICQILTGVSCLIQVSANRIQPDLPGEAGRLREINTRVIEAMNRARAICHGLHPVHTIGDTLGETLGELARQSAERFAIKIKLERLRKNTAIPAHTQKQLLSVFHIAQEAICNAIRHGQSTRITLRLGAHVGGRVTLQVEDNGRGLPRRKTAPEGIGLRTMRHRAARLGGAITLTPSPRAARGALLTLTYAPALPDPDTTL